MVNYRRNFVPGGTYFFTVTLRDRASRLLTEYPGLLRDAFISTKRRHPFHTNAIVVLPDHLHAIWTLPEGDADYPGRWKAIKSDFTRALVRAGVVLRRSPTGEYAVGQRRYWEHTISSAHDYEKHVDYIHFNPVKHGWAGRVIDWPHSSFHRYVSQGILSPD